ncbi:hypothetical protein G3601_004824 [Salmonella enterica]|uniref:Uncharacterized protein n=2 Tax=Salmonella enterica I TaxID=59201 RepID=A0A3Z6QSQ6_SALEB|nr:hypothetical protein [Salmonella enterica subsp. enterica serovar Java]EAO8766679.1 hypothetical protein [Salmonella enterica]ECD9517149.1 hypothetical protein [Salmonella enterica subsp. diarizonae]EDQ0182458.1 hypothetical protein [Salmonella enterica subsp. enterica serovar 4,[5],12:b:-]EEE5612774.1 hypothetical protein [Salmonella enterica subsp. enterica serovar Typhimurium]EGL0768345.1 hypothetical protein [Salmonella enterica subsp. enterica]HCM8912615.1 hypothetical protein [Salmon
MKTPRIFSSLAGRKINGAPTINLHRSVALCREYNFMLRKLQYFPCSLLHRRNISAGWSG